MYRKLLLIFLMIFFANLIQAEASLEEIVLKAQQGDSEAQYELGVKYRKGEEVKQSYKVAFYWLQEATNQEHAGAQYQLAQMYQYGEGVFKSDIVASDFYNKSAMQGYIQAQYALFEIYEKGGKRVSKDLIKAYVWISLVASQNPSYIKKKNKLKKQMSFNEINKAKELSKKLSQEIEERKRLASESKNSDTNECESEFDQVEKNH